MRQKGGEAIQMLTRFFAHALHVDQLEMGDVADKHRGQTDQRMHRGHELRHLGHLNFFRDIGTDDAAARD